MITCSYCNHPVSDQGAFCKNCGRPVKSARAIVALVVAYGVSMLVGVLMSPVWMLVYWRFGGYDLRWGDAQGIDALLEQYGRYSAINYFYELVPVLTGMAAIFVFALLVRRFRSIFAGIGVGIAVSAALTIGIRLMFTDLSNFWNQSYLAWAIIYYPIMTAVANWIFIGALIFALRFGRHAFMSVLVGGFIGFLLASAASAAGMQFGPGKPIMPFFNHMQLMATAGEALLTALSFALVWHAILKREIPDGVRTRLI